jgi:hypothetical protein
MSRHIRELVDLSGRTALARHAPAQIERDAVTSHNNCKPACPVGVRPLAECRSETLSQRHAEHSRLGIALQ